MISEILVFLSCERSFYLSSRGGDILRGGKKGWSRSPPPTSTSPTLISITGASTVTRMRRRVHQHGKLNSSTHLSFWEHKRFARFCIISNRNLSREMCSHKVLYTESYKCHDFVEWWMWPQTEVFIFLQVRSYSVARQRTEASPIRDMRLQVIWSSAGESCFPCRIWCIRGGAKVNGQNPHWMQQATGVDL